MPIHISLLPDTEDDGPLLAALMYCLVPGRVYEVRGVEGARERRKKARGA